MRTEVTIDVEVPGIIYRNTLVEWRPVVRLEWVHKRKTKELEPVSVDNSCKEPDTRGGQARADGWRKRWGQRVLPCDGENDVHMHTDGKLAPQERNDLLGPLLQEGKRG